MYRTTRIEIICTDSNENIVIKGTVKRKLSNLEVVGRENIRSVIQTLGLDPEINEMVPDQRIP